MEDNGSADYGLVVSFWIDTDGYTDRDREMFVCGVEFQMLYDRIQLGLGWNQCIHTENESRVRMLCGKLGRPVTLESHCDTWTYCRIERG